MGLQDSSNVTMEVKRRIQELVEKSLTALEIENSVSHTEVKLNGKNELFIIETGARMGGDFITSDLVRLSTGYDLVEGAIKLAIGQFAPPLVTSHFFSGVYFYSKLAPNVGQIIRNHELYPEIVEWDISNEPLMEVNSNADRGGYFLYQSKYKRLNIE